MCGIDSRTDGYRKDEDSHNGSRFNLTAGVVPSGAFSLTLQSSFGQAVDYVNTRRGVKTSLGSQVFFILGAHLQMGLDLTLERMTASSARLYTALIAQPAVTYHFNTRIFLRALLQYYDYDYNVSNYLTPVDPRYRKFFSQILFSYKLNPRTVFFLGYADNYLGGPEFGLTQKDRTVFVKIGYAWMI